MMERTHERVFFDREDFGGAGARSLAWGLSSNLLEDGDFIGLSLFLA